MPRSYFIIQENGAEMAVTILSPLVVFILSQLVSTVDHVATVDHVFHREETYDRLLEAVAELQKDVKTLVETNNANGRLRREIIPAKV